MLFDGVEDFYPLSPLQQGLLFHHLYRPESWAYFEQLTWRVTGPLDRGALLAAWRRVMARHAVLRTAFVWQDLDEPVQVVHRDPPLPVSQLDWSDRPAAERHRCLEELLRHDRERGFDVSRPPLMRLALIDMGEEGHQVVWSHHHLILDGWSVTSLLAEVGVLYEALCQGREPELPAPAPYRSYIAWLRRQELAAAEHYWRRTLGDLTAATPLPLPGPRNGHRPQRDYDRKAVFVTEAGTRALEAFAREAGLTLNTLVVGAWALLLARYSGEEDVVLGVTVSGRPSELPGVESILGVFINTLPLRVLLAPRARLRDWLGDLQMRQAEMRRHEHTPLVSVHGWSGVPRGEQLFQSIMVFQNRPVEDLSAGSDVGSLVRDLAFFERTDYPLTVMAGPGRRLWIEGLWETAVHDGEEVAGLLARLAGLLAELPRHADRPLYRVPLMDEAERDQVLRGWNATRASLPAAPSLAALFAARESRAPDAVAVSAHGASMTYGGLGARARRIAGELARRGVGPDGLVALCLPCSPEAAVAVLAVAAAGAAWMPLDPSYPRERLTAMLADAGAACLLTLADLAGLLPAAGPPVLLLDGPLPPGPAPLPAAVPPGCLAYALFTSGSTGRPKGVAMTQGALLNLLAWQEARAERPGAVTLQLAPLGFDVSVQEMFATWGSGGRLVLVDEVERRDPEALLDRLAEEGVERLFLPFVALRQLAEAAAARDAVPAALAEVITAGEQLRVTPEIAALFRRLPGATLDNQYGPTESHVVSAHRLAGEPAEWEPLPSIGRPLANVEIYLLDRHLEPVPPGMMAELYIGGEALARGYLSRPDLTAERFVPSPWAEEPGARLYRTGDLARFRASGDIEFHGRVDQQVKIRGFRVEPGEVEAALSELSGVRQAAVAAWEEGDGNRMLAAYLVADGERPTVAGLRRALERRLPAFMVPSAFVFLDALPLTPSGKLHRRALPPPTAGRGDIGVPFAAPRTGLERAVAGVFGDVLGHDRVGLHDDFFLLGGHSLKALQVASRLRRAVEAEVPLRLIFEHPKVEGLAAALAGIARQSAATLPPITRRQPADVYPLSYAQQRLWFLEQLEPGQATYHVPLALRLAGPLSVPALAAALDALVRRHESLRTVFTAADGRPVQRILPEASLELPVADVSGLPPERCEGEGRRLLAEGVRRPFRLDRAPLLRLLLVREAPDRQVLLAVQHHIVSDGWSVGLLKNELGALYQAFAAGRPSPLPEPPVQYADFAVWQRTWLTDERLEEEVAWWRERLAGAPPVLELPTDRPRPPLPSHRGGELFLELPADLAEELRRLARAQGATLFMVLLAAFAAVLGRWSGQREVVLGSPVANRNRAELEGLVGFLVNTLVLRTDLGGDPAFRDLLVRVRETTLDAYAHQDVPFERLVEELAPGRRLDVSPLFQAMLVLQNAPVAPPVIPGLSAELVRVGTAMAKFDLTLSFEERADGGLSAHFEHSADLFDGATVRRLWRHLTTLLRALPGEAGARLSRLPLAPAAERHQLVAEWNDTAVPRPLESTLHGLIAAQAARTPDAVAVVSGDEALTHAGLAARANGLARRLAALGCGPDQPVGICAERSLEMIVGLLAIVEAGGAYVPLDPTYPAERLAWMLEDADVPVLLAQRHLAAGLPAHGARVVLLDPAELAAGARPDRPAVEPDPEGLAYVIYTSGSTGRPKGAMNRHRGIVNRLLWMQAAFGLDAEDAVLQKTPASFDVSVWELFWPLLAGARLVMARPGGHQDADYLLDAIAREGVTTVHFVPSMLQVFLEAPGLDRCASLRRVIASGEALPWEVRQRFAERLGDPGPELHNLYGPTEAAVDVTWWACAPGGSRPVVPIGRPISNTEIHLLDRLDRPVPLGAAGELLIGGANLARGYWRRPDLSAERFVPDPLSGRPGARLYRTGDLARHRPDGAVEFLGRLDHQVKVRGFRIELGEVEAGLLAYPGVREAAAGVDGSGAAARLVAWVAADRPVDGLAEFLAERLPGHMVPSLFVALEALPTTPSGKLDRAALPAPGPVAAADDAAPASSLEERLCRLWAEVLGRERVGVRDDFFTLGGHSLLATRLVHRLGQELGVAVPLHALFRAPTVAALAEVVRRLRAERPEGEVTATVPRLVPAPADRFLPFPMTELQEAYWVGRSGVFELGNVAPHSYMEYELTGLDLGRLNGALQKLVARHDMLRAVVRPDGTLQVLERVPPYEVTVHDLRGRPAGEAEASLAELRAVLSHQILDAGRWPLFELHAALLDAAGPGESGRLRLFISADALVQDGWSGWLLNRELALFYSRLDAELPPLELTFRDYVLAERALRQSELYARSLAYWRERLADLPPGPELPLARDMAAIDRPRFERWSARLAPEAWQRLKARAARSGMTPSGLILAAFSRVLAAWSKSPCFTLVLTLFNRLPFHPQVNAIVGDFTSTVLVAVEGPAGESFEAAGRRLQDRLWQDLDHRYVSGVHLQRELARSRGVLSGGTFPVVVTSTLGVHDNVAERAAAALAEDLAGEVAGRLVFDISQTPQVWIDHQILELRGGLVYNWDVVAELFPPGLIDEMFAAYQGLLAALSGEEEAWIGPPRPLAAASWLELLTRDDSTGAPAPQGLLHTRVADQAARRPEQPAVIAPERTLSYRELDRLANRLARRLVAQGGTAGRPVAVVMEKGWEQAVAVLAVLRAGAAYLPIDPGYPAERLRHLLAVAEAEVTLVQPWIAEHLAWPQGVTRVAVAWEETGAADDEPLPVVQESEDLAYVVFTSGSTGQPKGVMIDHRGALNTVLDVNRRFAIGPEDRVLALSALNFDLSVWDLFGPLSAGGAVVVPRVADERDPEHWLELIRGRRVTVWNTVPALMLMLAEYLAAREDRRAEPLRLALLSGDWIPVTLPDRLRALVPGIEVVGLGGATEASIWSILHLVGEVDPAWTSIPYGRAMTGQSVTVRDRDLEPRPAWVPGDLYIGGTGLARGYWRDEEKTAVAFLADPRTGERLYRTGDLGRYRPDGVVEILGREDLQVKVRGYRIELGEVESVLQQHPAVQAAVAGAVGEGNRRQLVAWVVWRDEATAAGEELRRFLAERLPPYMVPASFHELPRLPLTANGKVDRGRLARETLATAAVAAGTGEAPAEVTAVGRRVAEIVAAELGLPAVRPEATLVELGATSFDLVRIANRLEDEFGFRPRMDRMLRQSLREAVLAFYDERRAAGDPVASPPRAAPAAGEGRRGGWTVLRDPEEREQLKRRRLALRREEPGQPAFDLPAVRSGAELAQRFLRRRSRRRFAAGPVPFAAIAGLLEGLRQLAVGGEAKYLYGSAGGVYPVQTHLYVKPGGVEGLAAGAYYHHPVHHRLQRLSEESIEARAFGWLNEPVFEQASFALFLTGELAAMGPMYGPLAERFCGIEAGLMTQMLEAEAPEHGIGLCQIGWVEEGPLGRLLGLADTQVYLHGLLGGRLDEREEAARLATAKVVVDWEEGSL